MDGLRLRRVLRDLPPPGLAQWVPGRGPAGRARRLRPGRACPGRVPALAGGPGTPEGGRRTVPQGLEISRGCRGLNLVGADLVAVSTPYDPSGNTALLGANLLFEMLCVLPRVAYR